jgi:uncharacterized protein YgiB involved in biofilm formation
MEYCEIMLLIKSSIYYDGDNILKGWHEHFQTLAQPADDPSYNIQYKQQCQTDYNNIKDIYKNIPPKIITMEERCFLLYALVFCIV